MDCIISRFAKQIRAIKKFAKSHRIYNLDLAALQWVSTGCAERWARQNPVEDFLPKDSPKP